MYNIAIMAHSHSEVPGQPENLSPAEVQEHIASLGPIFDLLAEQGNNSARGAALNTSRLRISPFYDSNNATVRSLQGLVYDANGDVEGKLIFTGYKTEQPGCFSWLLTKYPVSDVQPTEEAVRLAEQHLVPVARTWQSLPEKAQELYLNQLVPDRERSARRTKAASIARFISRAAKA